MKNKMRKESRYNTKESHQNTEKRKKKEQRRTARQKTLKNDIKYTLIINYLKCKWTEHCNQDKPWLNR